MILDPYSSIIKRAAVPPLALINGRNGLTPPESEARFKFCDDRSFFFGTRDEHIASIIRRTNQRSRLMSEALSSLGALSLGGFVDRFFHPVSLFSSFTKNQMRKWFFMFLCKPFYMEPGGRNLSFVSYTQDVGRRMKGRRSTTSPKTTT
jgi:hypothetical protein